MRDFVALVCNVAKFHYSHFNCDSCSIAPCPLPLPLLAIARADYNNFVLASGKWDVTQSSVSFRFPCAILSAAICKLAPASSNPTHTLPLSLSHSHSLPPSRSFFSAKAP